MKKVKQQQKDGVDISSATTNTFNIASAVAANAGSYACVVEGFCGSITSNSAVLEINIETEITKQPVSIEADEDENVYFNVETKGTSLAYQWQFNNVDIDGEENPALELANIMAVNQGNYAVVVSGDCGELTSNEVSLTVITSVTDLVAYGISIYPNPSNGVFKIDMDNAIQEMEVQVLNYEGQTIYS